MAPTSIAIIQGASRGIGSGLARHILRHDTKLTVIATSRTPDKTWSAVLDGQDEAAEKRLRVLNIDVTKEDTIRSAREQVEKEFGTGSIKCLFNMSGVLFPEKTVTKASYNDVLETFKVNTLGPLFMMKHFLPLIPREPLSATTLFPQDFSIIASMSARVGSIADNKLGGWYSYRSSKAAQNQITKTLGLELGMGGCAAVAIGYHPGTVETALSGEMGKKRLERGERGVFTVEEAVEKMVHVMRQVKRGDSGSVLDWDGKRVPW